MYAAVPGGDPGSRSPPGRAVSDSVTVTGSVICIPGNCVFPFILVQCAKHTTLVTPYIDAWVIFTLAGLNYQTHFNIF